MNEALFCLKNIDEFDAVYAGVTSGDHDSIQKAIGHTIDILAHFLPKDRDFLIDGEGAVFDSFCLMVALKEVLKDTKLQAINGESNEH